MPTDLQIGQLRELKESIVESTTYTQGEQTVTVPYSVELQPLWVAVSQGFELNWMVITMSNGSRRLGAFIRRAAHQLENAPDKTDWQFNAPHTKNRNLISSKTKTSNNYIQMFRTLAFEEI